MNEEKIFGGCFQIARKIFNSDIWLNKPSKWKVIWIYILGNVSHSKNDKFEIGEGFFNFSKDRKLIGNDISLDTIKKFVGWARGCLMIRTTKSTRGTKIKVLNFAKYQDIDNYRSTKQSTLKALSKHFKSTTINNNDNNDNNEKNIHTTCVEPSGSHPLTPVQIIVHWFYSIKGWTYDKSQQITFRRFLRPAKDILDLTQQDIELAKQKIKFVGDWAEGRGLDWNLETVIKKWNEIDNLTLKEPNKTKEEMDAELDQILKTKLKEKYNI